MNRVSAGISINAPLIRAAFISERLPAPRFARRLAISGLAAANGTSSQMKDLQVFTGTTVGPGAMDTSRPMPDFIARWMAVSHSARSEEHTSELQSLRHLVCRLL